MQADHALRAIRLMVCISHSDDCFGCCRFVSRHIAKIKIKTLKTNCRKVRKFCFTTWGICKNLKKCILEEQNDLIQNRFAILKNPFIASRHANNW